MKIQGKANLTQIFETISHALPVQKLREVLKDLKEAGYEVDEAGTVEDPEGHVVTASKDGVEVFLADFMHNTNKPYYMVRAMNGLII